MVKKLAVAGILAAGCGLTWCVDTFMNPVSEQQVVLSEIDGVRAVVVAEPVPSQGSLSE